MHYIGWQGRFSEHLIDYEHHIDYIHYNPVKHGFVSRPANWEFSSIHRYIKSGILNEQGGAGEMNFAVGVGYE